MKNQGRIVVILLTRFNGPAFALNPDLIERADHTPDTVITLVDGTKYVIAESLDELIRIMRRHRAGVLADAELLINGHFREMAWPPAGPEGQGPLLESVQSDLTAGRGHDDPDENQDGDGPGPGPAEQVQRIHPEGRHPSSLEPAPSPDVIPFHRRGQ